MATISFKHYYKSSTTIGSGTIKFIPYTATEPLTQLATPQNVTANGTTVSWDEVENATSYEIYADGVSIGTVNNTYSLTISDGYVIDGIPFYYTNGTEVYIDGVEVCSVYPNGHTQGSTNIPYFNNNVSQFSLNNSLAAIKLISGSAHISAFNTSNTYDENMVIDKSYEALYDAKITLLADSVFEIGWFNDD